MSSQMNAWLFPGQGSQAIGMGTGLPAFEALCDQASNILGYDLHELCSRGPADRLDSTEVAQPALLCASVAAAEALGTYGLRPNALAGHSVGEFAAVVVAGMMSFEDAVRVVDIRGRMMARAAWDSPGGMAAVLAPPADQIDQIIDSVDSVWLANENCPGQIVISGADESLREAAEAFLKHGARKVVRLRVSVAAHSPIMAPAAHELEIALKEIDFRPPTVPLAMNSLGALEQDPEVIRRCLVDVMSSTVHFEACLKSLNSFGCGTFIEAGPGSVLSGLVKRTISDARSLQCASDEQAETAAEELAE